VAYYDAVGEDERFAGALGDARPLAREVWLRVRAAWPAIVVAPERFAEHVGRVIATGEVTLDELRAEDLYVSLAACDGDIAALDEIERLLDPLRGRLVRSGFDASLVDDAMQTVRYRLLVAVPGRDAKLTTYRGRGSLAGWLRVVALRQVRALAGGPRPERSDSALAGAITEADAAMVVLVRTHGPVVRRMFRDALGTLDERGRALLRMEIVDGLPHAQIAELYGVHRTTALRWIDDAREALAAEVRRRLKRELDLSDDSAASLLRALAGQIEISLGSGLISTI
jgi:RNA polymerase sigma-70 factor (ECF subfamily)